MLIGTGVYRQLAADQVDFTVTGWDAPRSSLNLAEKKTEIPHAGPSD